MPHSDDANAQDPGGNLPAAISPSGGGDGLRRSRSLTRWQGTVLALLGGALLFGACQGDNLFSGNSESTQPRVVGIAVPAQVFPGDTVLVQVSAYGARQITSISVQLAGAVSFDTTITVTPATTVATTLRVPLLGFLSDTLLIIHAVAYDKSGAVSRMRSDTTRAVAPPAVVQLTSPDSVRPGAAVTFSVRAVGVRPITKIRFALRGAVNRVDSIMVTQPRKDVTENITIPLSVTDVVDTMLVVDVQPTDNSGLQGFITRDTVPVAVPAPVITLLTVPDTVWAGSAIEMTVQARGLRALTKLSVSLRGGVFRDTMVTVTVPSRSITQTASFLVPASVQDSVRMSVSVMDAAGVLSQPSLKNVRIPTGAPVVDSLIIAGDSIRPGTPLDAHVVAHGSRTITSLTLTLRGAYNQDVTVTPTPASSSVMYDFSVPLGPTPADSMLVITAKATDAAGRISAGLQRVLRISDTAGPAVTATLSASSVAGGRPIQVHVIASDNVGLGLVGVRFFDLAGLQVTGDSTVTVGRNRDTTFTVMVPASPPRKLNVIGFAYDRSNHVGLSAIQVLQVVDSAGPTVDITSPVANATVPIGDSLAVTLGVTDLVGIRSITLSGVAIRTAPSSDPVVVPRFAARTVTFPQAPSNTLPLNPTITRFLQPVNDTTAEQVRIIALVTDSLGLTGVDTAYVNMGGPRVEIRSPVNGSPPMALGLPLQVRLFAYDRASGIDSVRLDVVGPLGRDSVKCGIAAPSCSLVPSADSVVWNTSFTPASAGQYTLTATAWNRRGIVGRGPQLVVINVAAGGTTDPLKPFVQIAGITVHGVALADLTRVELTDSIAVQLKGLDNGSSGLARLGLTVLALPNGAIPGLRPDTQKIVFAPALAGETNHTFYVMPRDFGLTERSAALGRALSVQLQFSAFARDGAGNCGATAQIGVYDSIPCAYAYNNPVPDTFFTASGRAGFPKTIALVGGRTLSLPGGGKIADAVVDAPHMQLYLANIGQNKVDVLRLTDTTFVPSGAAAGNVGLVGSQPWGLFLNGGGDSLFVANSGSTNLSVLSLNPGNPATYLKEDLNRRVFTPNEVLFEVKTQISNGVYRYTVTYYDFSDRPQFVAQDVRGRLVYSTVPTGSAPDGTVRYVIPVAPPLKLEPKLLFNTKAVVPTPDVLAIASVDSVVVLAGGTSDDRVVIYDHVPGHAGDPTYVIASNSGVPASLQAAVDWMKTVTTVGVLCAPPVACTDGAYYAGKWDVAFVGMSDTTFLAVSGGREKVAFGEGGTSPTGRIMLWDGTKPIGQEQISSEVAVQDLVNNAAERVFGLGLNLDGSLGVARGVAGAYFFTPDLRLQGLFPTPGSAGGAAMHPLNSGPLDATNNLAFISTPNHAIKILDSVHFFQRGEIQMRDNVVGPVKAGLPFASENAGLLATDPDYILVKLYCVTADAAGNTQVVIINVRNKDLTS